MEKEVKIFDNIDLTLVIDKEFPKIGLDHLEKHDVTPATFERIARTYSLGFEYKYIDLERADDVELFSEVFSEGKFLRGRVIVLTDYAIGKKVCYSVHHSFLEKFVLDTYPEMADQNFFQPLDSIFLGIEERMAVIIHHEGYYMRIRW